MRLGYEAIEFAIRKFLTKNTKGIATIPGQKMKDKIKILVDKYADQFRIKGQNINTVTVKQVDNAIDYGMSLKKQQTKKLQDKYDKAKAEYDYIASEKGIKEHFDQFMNKTPEEIREIMRKQGLTPVEDRPFQGFTPKLIPKETEAQIKARMVKQNKETAERIRQRRYEEALKAEKEKAAKDPNYIPDIIDPEDFASGGIARVGYAGGLLVKGGKWFLKSLNDTKEKIKLLDISLSQKNQYLDQIEDQIRRINAGEPIPDEVIQTIRSDPKFKGVWQNKKSSDPDLREMEEVLLEYGKKHAEGGLQTLNRPGYESGLKVYPKIDITEIGKTDPFGADISQRDITVGGTGLYQGDNWFAGAEGLTGKTKVDVTADGQTLYKDTMSKDDALNYIIGLGEAEGDKFQIKSDEDFNNVQIVFKKKFNQGGRASLSNGGLANILGV